MLPDRKVVRDLFEGLLGRDVQVLQGKPVDIGIPKPVVAAYVDNDFQLRSVVLMDLDLAARAGAAIALVPKGAADDAIESTLLMPHLFENAAEICNVLAASLGDASGVHQRLSMCYAPSDPVPQHILNIATQMAARDDVVLDISAYGKGTLSMVASL
jgi:hypothetical protein